MTECKSTCDNLRTPEALLEIALMRLREQYNRARVENLHGSVGVEISLNNGRPHTVSRIYSGRDK